MKKILIAVTIIAVLAAAGAGLLYWRALQSSKKALFEKPPFAATAVRPATPDSSVGVEISLPYAELAALANQEAPSNVTGQGNGPDQCRRILGRKVCVSTQYDYTVTRSGAVGVGAGADGTLRVTVPLAITGHGGIRGDTAKALGLNAKNFRAAIVARAELKADLGADWCPKVSVDAGYEWTHGAQVEITDGVWIDVSHLVDGPLTKQVHKMGDKLAASIKCDRIKPKVEKIWKIQSFPINAPNGATLYVNVTPISFGASPMVAAADAARFALRLRLRTEVSGTPVATQSLPLPVVQHLALEAGHLSLSVPIRLAYTDIDAQLMRMAPAGGYSVPTAAGTAAITVAAVDVYPSGDWLVLGVQFQARLPGRLLDTSGWVYFLAHPVVSADGQSLSLADLHYSQVLDNGFWNVASIAFDDTIRAALQKNAVFNLEKPIEQTKAALLKKAAEPHDGVVINLGNPSIRLGAVVPGQDGLFAEGLFDSQAEVSLQ